MQRTIELIQNGQQYELNGVTLSRSDLCLLLGIHGYDIDEGLGNLDLYFKVVACLKELPEDELIASLEDYSNWSPELRVDLAIHVDRMRGIIDCLGKN